MWSSRLIQNGQSNGWGNVKNIKVKPLPQMWRDGITVYGKHHILSVVNEGGEEKSKKKTGKSEIASDSD